MLPVLTKKETVVWAACCAHDAKAPGTYVPLEELQWACQKTMTRRSLAGLVSSLQAKGYLFAFSGRSLRDVELTCDARKAHGLKNNGWCNGRNCSHLRAG